MNYSTFSHTVKQYLNEFSSLKRKKGNVLVSFDHSETALFSIAPLSCALDTLGTDLHVTSNKQSLENLKKMWDAAEELKRGEKTSKALALQTFLSFCPKEFKDSLQRPILTLATSPKGFAYDGGILPYHTTWAKPRLEKALKKTAQVVWKEVFALKKSEHVNITFEPVPRIKGLELPLDDYLDSYFITQAMIDACPSSFVNLQTHTNRESSRDSPVPPADLSATLLGCELSKESKEPVFAAYRKMSETLHLLPPIIPQAVFGIYAKGYNGKHVFGEQIGYPTPNGKTRWQTPSNILFKFDFLPQSLEDSRPPQSRIGFTETLPIDVFIHSVHVDYRRMTILSKRIKKILDDSVRVHVVGKPQGKYQTKLVVYLEKEGKRYLNRVSVSNVKHIINPFIKKERGVETGMMGNIPSGETFTTPVSMDGTFIGDVVIAIDQSYLLSPKKPIIVSVKDGFYTVISGDKRILSKLEKKKKDSWAHIMELSKNPAVSKELIEQKKANFNRIGEFAINTNPKAKLCDYLIVNEKIANMIHIALGSGYETDRDTEYHVDIVINSPRQQLDLYGEDASGRIFPIHKNGHFIPSLVR